MPQVSIHSSSQLKYIPNAKPHGEVGKWSRPVSEVGFASVLLNIIHNIGHQADTFEGWVSLRAIDVI